MNTKSAKGDCVDLDLSPREFRTLGYWVVGLIADYYASVRQVPVFPP